MGQGFSYGVLIDRNIFLGKRFFCQCQSKQHAFRVTVWDLSDLSTF